MGHSLTIVVVSRSFFCYQSPILSDIIIQARINEGTESVSRWRRPRTAAADLFPGVIVQEHVS